MLEVLVAVLLMAGAEPPADALPLEHFEKRVRPLLAENCLGCHGPAKQKAGLRLDGISSILKGGESGPALVPGDPAKSRLIDAVRYANVELQMPPKGKLPDAAIADLETWVRLGAPWPAGPAGDAAPSASPPAFDLEKRRQSHWSWRPIREPDLPPVRDAGWPSGPPDRFLLSRLEAESLRPAPPAGARTLIRRLHHDLVGLPAPPDVVESFVRDESPGAYERVVERLLASPAFGERWARHWLDLVRYAETLGHEFDYPIPSAWRYRDYVIRAFNSDLPHDQLMTEHLAGDLVDPPRRGPEGENESVQATGFFWLGQQVHSPVDQRQHTADRIDNQIDVLAKTFLGLTVACARCHDHKFDAISQRDYYSFYGIVMSSRYTQAQIDAPERIAQKARRLAELKREACGELEAKLESARSGRPAAAAQPRPGDVLVASFDGADWAGWLPDGPAFAGGPARDGDFIVRADPAAPGVDLLLGGWAHSASLSKRLQGALRSPELTLERRYVHAWAAGRASRINVVVDGFIMIRDPIYGVLKRVLDADVPGWITIDVEMWKGRRAYIELVDLGPADLGDEARKGGYGPDGWIAVDRIVLSDDPSPPQAADSLGSISRIPLEKGGDRWAGVLEEYGKVEASIPEPTFVPAMADGDGGDEPIFLRGNPKSPGVPAPRRNLEALDGASQPRVERGSGRLELARRLADPGNPFLARVMVNRVWSRLFGRGIVPLPDDFGALGQPPSHPELLDWLADWYRREGWSTKKLVRLLVTSSAYRMSSFPADAAAEERDPQDILLHRMRVRRMEGEEIRDAALALSDRLDPRSFGPPVPVHLTSFMEGRGRPGSSGPLDGAGRRSVYVEVRRNFLVPMMTAFDTPTPATTVGKRSASNVPAQALILMNDPFIALEAREWAARLLTEVKESPGSRVRAMYEAALARAPTAEELEMSLRFLAEQGTAYGLPPESRLNDPKTWADLCHVMFNVKELVYVN